MATLYTKNGIPLTVQGNAVFNPASQNFGYVQGDRVYVLRGRYRGTIVNDRLIYRSTDSATIGSPRAPVAGVAYATASRVASADCRDAPNIQP